MGNTAAGNSGVDSDVEIMQMLRVGRRKDGGVPIFKRNKSMLLHGEPSSPSCRLSKEGGDDSLQVRVRTHPTTPRRFLCVRPPFNPIKNCALGLACGDACAKSKWHPQISRV